MAVYKFSDSSGCCKRPLVVNRQLRACQTILNVATKCEAAKKGSPRSSAQLRLRYHRDRPIPVRRINVSYPDLIIQVKKLAFWCHCSQTTGGRALLATAKARDAAESRYSSAAGLQSFCPLSAWANTQQLCCRSSYIATSEENAPCMQLAIAATILVVGMRRDPAFVPKRSSGHPSESRRSTFSMRKR
jgi:hypothetical protein